MGLHACPAAALHFLTATCCFISSLQGHTNLIFALGELRVAGRRCLLSWSNRVGSSGSCSKG